MLTSILRIPSLTCCCKRLYVVCHIPSFVCWPPCPSGRFVLSGHLLSHNQRYGDRKVLALKQSLLRRLSFQKVLHQPAFEDTFTASSYTVAFVPSLSQPHSSTLIWQPVLLPAHLFSAHQTPANTHSKQRCLVSTKNPFNVILSAI
jgi:hypothetical protein